MARRGPALFEDRAVSIKLSDLEQSVIRPFPGTVQTSRMLSESGTIGCYCGHDDTGCGQEGYRTGFDSRVDTEVSFVNRADATVPEVTHLIITAMNTCFKAAWHSSYPWSTTQSERQWGESMVVLLDEAGNFFYGKLRLALTHGK